MGKENSAIVLSPIGIIRTPFLSPKNTPIQVSSDSDKTRGTIEVFSQFADGLADLAGFERIWLIYRFHQVQGAPRLRVTPFLDDREHGIFATRSPCRPNAIGMSAVRLEKIEGLILHVSELDIVDGTPLLDIKPYAPRFDHFEVTRCGWLDETRSTVTRADGRFE